MAEIQAGLYLRLSNEDRNAVGESCSIVNQRNLLTHYCNLHGYPICGVFLDDGYSGLHFERPGFRAMLEQIEHRTLNVVLVKDLSRLGRDYIAVGTYVEKYFPQHGVRFIAVNDDIDSACETEGNDLLAFRAVFNDLYAKEASQKVRAVLELKKRTGQFIGAFAPYGYQKDLHNKNHLVVNPQTAPIVRQIYTRLLSGETLCEIADALSAQGIPSPVQERKRAKGGELKHSPWNTASIHRILTSQTYAGHLTQGRTRTMGYKQRGRVHLPAEDWAIVLNTHEALIEQDVFLSVQKRMAAYGMSSTGAAEPPADDPLKGLVFCGDCKGPMAVSTDRSSIRYGGNARRYYVCRDYKTNGAHAACTSHCMRDVKVLEAVESVVEDIVCEALISRADSLQKQDAITKRGHSNQVAWDRELLAAYLNRSKGEEGWREFAAISQSIDEKKHLFFRQWDAGMERLLSPHWMNRATLQRLVERIEVLSDRSICLKLKFSSRKEMK